MSYYSDNSNEIYDAQSSIRYYQNEIASQENTRAAIQAKIDRLIPVRDSIANYKISVQSEKNLINSYKNEYNDLNDWKGSNHDSFMKDYCDILLTDYKNYYDQVDNIHDTLNNEISRLQNSIYEMDGVLGWLRGRLNDCWTWLNNLVN